MKDPSNSNLTILSTVPAYIYNSINSELSEKYVQREGEEGGYMKPNE